MSPLRSSLSAPAFGSTAPKRTCHAAKKEKSGESTHENNSGRASSPTTALLYHFWAHGAAKNSCHDELPTKASGSSFRQRFASDVSLVRSAARILFAIVTVSCCVLVVRMTGNVHRTKGLTKSRDNFVEPNSQLLGGMEDFPSHPAQDKPHVKARPELPSSAAGVNNFGSTRVLKNLPRGHASPAVANASIESRNSSTRVAFPVLLGSAGRSVVAPSGKRRVSNWDARIRYRRPFRPMYTLLKQDINRVTTTGNKTK